MKELIFEQIIDGLVTEGYYICDKPLSSGVLKELLTCARVDKTYKKAGISSTQKFHLDRTKRADKIAWIDEDGAIQSQFLAFSEALREYLNRTLYLGLNYYEAHFALYEAGDFYEKHLDAFKGSKNRVVTTVLYLNEDWKEENGGELLIYDEDDKLIQRVLPEMGTFVVFLSDKFPHEVLPSKIKRHSIAGWYRIDR